MSLLISQKHCQSKHKSQLIDLFTPKLNVVEIDIWRGVQLYFFNY